LLDGKLGITIQGPPPKSWRRTHLLYSTYSYYILSCVWKLATSLLVLRHYEHLYIFYVNTARDVVTVLLIFAKFYLFTFTFKFTCTYRGTHTQPHMYNQHTRGMATTRHRSLVERGGRKALLETLHTHTKKIFTNLKKRLEHIELPAKLLDYYLRSNKSNINQIGPGDAACWNAWHAVKRSNQDFVNHVCRFADRISFFRYTLHTIYTYTCNDVFPGNHTWYLHTHGLMLLFLLRKKSFLNS